MPLLFIHQNSARLQFILEWVFGSQQNSAIAVCHNWEEFENADALIKLVYVDKQSNTDENLGLKFGSQPSHSKGKYIWIHNSGLLFETGFDLEKNTINKADFSIQNLKSAFPLVNFPFDSLETLFLSTNCECPGQRNALFFDVFSMIFWCITRYEEYQWWESILLNSSKTQPDHSSHSNSNEMLRFPATESLLVTANWILEPLVDKAIWLLNALCELPQPQHFQVVPTADIDMALRYGGRNIWHYFGSMIKDLFIHPVLIPERLATFFGKKDPYAIDKLATFFQHQPHHKIFVLFSKKRSATNKQISTQKLKHEITNCASLFPNLHWGIHPSVQFQTQNSNEKILDIWNEEKLQLESCTHLQIVDSRFHYIHLQLPKHYQNLTTLEIQHDWSMGYPEMAGFRAGTSRNYTWFDLSKEEKTTLQIHPFCIMDVTCKNYMRLNLKASADLGKILINKLRPLGGTFCFIIHNESISNSYPWVGWKSVINQWLDASIQQPKNESISATL